MPIYEPTPDGISGKYIYKISGRSMNNMGSGGFLVLSEDGGFDASDIESDFFGDNRGLVSMHGHWRGPNGVSQSRALNGTGRWVIEVSDEQGDMWYPAFIDVDDGRGTSITLFRNYDEGEWVQYNKFRLYP